MLTFVIEFTLITNYNNYIGLPSQSFDSLSQELDDLMKVLSKHLKWQSPELNIFSSSLR